ncbi:hypothetical protein POKO110462_05610 [Pontibacter korlensis]|uniref:Uncharacterized protein n=1 Tax=Pontibacter korlensis TaxID=400092 RepID=A0A0E3ZDX0_9BACT|nr:hypothetical protein [Pontibacter korlensis]AKD03425.1 hypothetical protein PKOR_10180 [Pontibacter korlensis]
MSLGCSFLSKGIHATISFGNASGLLDLHLTRDEPKIHYSVITVSHENFLILINHFTENIISYLPADKAELHATTLILPLSGTEHSNEQIVDDSLNLNLTNFYNSKTGKKLRIDGNSSELKNMVALLGDDFKQIWMKHLISVEEFEANERCTGLLIGNEQVSLLFTHEDESKPIQLKLDIR